MLRRNVNDRERARHQNRRNRNAKPVLERLGERIMPVVQSSLSVAGVLSLVGDASPAQVLVDRDSSGQLVVTDGRSLIYKGAASRVSRIDFFGGAGNDSFKNVTAIPTRAFGNAGNDILAGGAGVDQLFGGSGDDVLLGGDGDDVLVDGLGRNTLEGNAGANAIAGIDGRPMKANRLEADGDLWAAIEDAGNGNQILTLSGPSGYGIQVVGRWKVTTTASGDEEFTSLGNAVLKTALGDLPLGGTLKVMTHGDGITGVGRVKSTSIDRIDWMNAGNASPLSKLRDQSGINLALPTVGGWSIVLGKDLKKTTPGPWNDAVPYLVVQTGQLPSLTVGSTFATGQIAAGYVPQVYLVCDPADLFVYVKAEHLPFGKVDTLEFGYSSRGLIPFTPTTKPADADDDFFGHLYFRGNLDLGSVVPTYGGKAKPLEFFGTFDVNLDAGSGLGMRKASDVLSDTSLLKNLAVAVNIDAGMSAKFSSDTPLPKTSLALPIAGGTIIYDPLAQELHIRTSSKNPLRDAGFLKNTPLAALEDVGADVDLTVGKSAFRLTASSVGAINAWEFTATKDYIEATATVKLNLGFDRPSCELTGRVNFDGTFRMEGTLEHYSIFGRSGQWNVVWTEDGVDLYNGVKDFGVEVFHTFKDGVIQATNEFYNGTQTIHTLYSNGRLVFRKTWGRAGQTMEESWDTTGRYVQEQFNTAGQIVRQYISLKGVTQFRRTWDYANGRHILEVYRNGKLAAGSLYDIAGNYIRELDLVSVLWGEFTELF